ncbi:class I SAM-dependent methyltransferase [Brachybacterium huguangmaarense]
MSGADATDRLILAVAAEEGVLGPDAPRGALAAVDDGTGALTAAALEAAGEAGVVSWARSARTARDLRAAFADAIAAGRLDVPGPDGAADPVAALGSALAARDVVGALVRLPKSLRALEATAATLAGAMGGAAEAPGTTLVAGGRVKHMTRTQNDVLARVFTGVRATRGAGKSRCLVAGAPLPSPAAATPEEGAARVRVRGAERAIALRGVGGVFGGASADAGSLLLLRALDEHFAEELADASSVVDLGCGNGLLTAYLAAALPGARILASDDDLDAIASTRATLAASGLDGVADAARVEVAWDTSLSRAADASADLVVLNPPFHDGTAVDTTLVQDLLDAVARVLRPGGRLWMVHNSHLRYRPEVERRVGSVQQRARDRRFTVLRAVRRG